MKRSHLSLVSLLLMLAMLIGAFAACTDPEENSSNVPETEASEPESTSATDETEGSETVTDDPATDTNASETATDTETESESSPVGPQLEGKNALIIENADSLKNGVTAYFTEAERDTFAFANQEMALSYALEAHEAQLVTSLANKEGKTYIENTMDVFVTMKNGKTFYASDSSVRTNPNIYRFGYYFYEMRLEEQVFTGAYDESEVYPIDLSKITHFNQLRTPEYANGELSALIKPSANDPYVVITDSLACSTADYQLLEFYIKANEKVTSGSLFIAAGDHTTFNSQQNCSFGFKTDGEYHRVVIRLTDIPGYTGNLKGIRLDINGKLGEFSIKDMRLLPLHSEGSPEGLAMNRSFNVYSDKMHHTIQLATEKTVTDIEKVGMLTKINADTVAKLIVKDKDGHHEALDGVDWASAEYVGFDIKDAGIFGYILPFDGKGGQIQVTLENGVYSIIQTIVPENNTIKVSVSGTNNANDFYFGQRIYTDASHDFEEFLYEAYCERNPLAADFFKIEDKYSDPASYKGYDSLRGVYTYLVSVSTGGFSVPYEKTPNKHYRLNFDIRGDGYDRSIYILTYSNKSGGLECSVLLDENDMLIPVPIEVGKNFSEGETGEQNLFNKDDASYSEAIFPMVIKAKSRDNVYTILNLYQRWGNFPLKQISWIQYSAPYYHLSTGVTETNCILPWSATKGTTRGLNTLPDFRSMSAPFWKTQPQHNSCGSHMWLRYTDADGNYSASENYLNTIDSYGPTYADVKMDYMSDDGRIKLSYVHSEMPQTDENRTYYEMRYEILEDISFKDFSRDFKFYTVVDNDPTGLYQNIGYLNESNESVVVDLPEVGTQYVLGDNCPYFSYFNMTNYGSTSAEGYSNVAFLVYNYEIIINGEKADANFVINVENNAMISLSLDLGEITLKAGDSISINAILLPWGSQESIYDGSNGLAPDQNVRDVRENTLLNPLTATAIADCEVIESVYIPKLKTTNGESAEFTLSGGHNNAAVRIYGFDKMTVPTVYEKIGGEWVPYVMNSLNTPDQNGDAHIYDGYMIHYDGDGSFSYSFVTEMKNGAPRTFKIVADGSVEKWGREEVKTVKEEGPLKVYADGQVFYNNKEGMLNYSFISKCEVMEEGDESFVRLYGAGPNGSYEGYCSVFSAEIGKVTGHYAVVRYRIPTSNKGTIGNFEFFTSTTVASATNTNDVPVTGIKADGEWQVLIVDLSKVISDDFSHHFVPSNDGTYGAQFLRFDFFNSKMETTDYIDIAYVGMDDNLEILRELNSDLELLTLIEGNDLYDLSVKTGEKTPSGMKAPDIPAEMVHPDSSYKRSDMMYFGYLDGVNGKTNGACSINYNQDTAVFNYAGYAIGNDTEESPATVKGPNLVLSGWFMIEGGVEKYVWSTDGITWHDVKMFNRTGLDVARADIIAAATGRAAGAYTYTEADAVNGSFQGIVMPRGISADLSRFAGQSVNVIFAAVPKKAPDTLCPIVCVADVRVDFNAEAAAPPVPEVMVDPASGYTRSTLFYAGILDGVNGLSGTTSSCNHAIGGGIVKLSGKSIADDSIVNSASVNGPNVVISGWFVVQGGVQKYVWSADGGKTWKDVSMYNRTSVDNANDAMLKSATARNGNTFTFTEADAANGSFQGISSPRGLCADLSEYIGQAVNVIFAAIPAKAPDTLCPIVCIADVRVVSQPADAPIK